ncbi:hypothetical protein E6O75_ATG03241 [Venturia nashicola]|uniref:Uncharacterized protein n=1 Tax=Venturia nashicola TaxID=86259 RepID=A0A4Z1P650_9PEZI|nr:hypothetical protein E6O75_ATG03241 [Venturia nashicola]
MHCPVRTTSTHAFGKQLTLVLNITEVHRVDMWVMLSIGIRHGTVGRRGEERIGREDEAEEQTANDYEQRFVGFEMTITLKFYFSNPLIIKKTLSLGSVPQVFLTNQTNQASNHQQPATIQEATDFAKLINVFLTSFKCVNQGACPEAIGTTFHDPPKAPTCELKNPWKDGGSTLFCVWLGDVLIEDIARVGDGDVTFLGDRRTCVNVQPCQSRQVKILEPDTGLEGESCHINQPDYTCLLSSSLTSSFGETLYSSRATNTAIGMLTIITSLPALT